MELFLLSEKGQLGTKTGTIIISAAILDDVIALIAVTLVSMGFNQSSFNPLNCLPVVGYALGLLSRRLTWNESSRFSMKLLCQWILFPAFFGSIGLGLSFKGLANHLILIIFMILLATTTKLFGAYGGARLAQINNHTSLAIGAGMVSREVRWR